MTNSTIPTQDIDTDLARADIFEDLNESQSQAVSTLDGPVIVLAGAGAGKTTVLIRRIANLIMNGVAPMNILAVTFTNKAASELRDRLTDLVGEPGSLVVAGTFHSVAFRKILKRFANPDFLASEGLSEKFVIMDNTDSSKLKKETLKELTEYDRDQVIINEWKLKDFEAELTVVRANGLNRAEYIKDIRPGSREEGFKLVVANFWESYEKKCRAANGVDFDDILLLAHRMIKNDSSIAEFLSREFSHIMLDEYQDTNPVQMKIMDAIAGQHRNICVVGDEKQCVHKDTLISTSKGEKSAGDLIEGDMILAYRNGNTAYQSVEKIMPSPWTEARTITTESGRYLTMSPNHRIYATQPDAQPGWLLCLTYTIDSGFSLVIADGSIPMRKHASDRNSVIGSADSIWVIQSSNDRDDIIFFNDYYTQKYALKQRVFSNVNASISRPSFSSMADEKNLTGYDLLEDGNLLIDYPLWTHDELAPDNNPKTVTLSCHNLHGNTVSIEWIGDELNSLIPEQFQDAITLHENNLSHLSITESSYRDALNVAQTISQAVNLPLKDVLVLGDDEDYLRLHTSSALVCGMSVLVCDNPGEPYLEKITSIEDINAFDEPLLDLSVNDASNFFGNGILSHNSIYGFRGATIDVILSFKDRYPDASIVNMHTNYRSNPAILSIANGLSSAMSEKLTDGQLDSGCNHDNADPDLIQYKNDRDEAAGIISDIKVAFKNNGEIGKNIAILYRNRSLKTLIERELLKNNIPYAIYGDTSFFERKEVKDTVALIRYMYHPWDSMAALRVLEAIKIGLSPKRAQAIAQEEGINVHDALVGLSMRKGKNAERLRVFLELLNAMREAMDSGEDPEYIYEDMFDIWDSYVQEGLEKYVASSTNPEGESSMSGRKENVEYVLTRMREHLQNGKSIDDVIEDLTMLIEDTAGRGKAEDDQKVRLMTIHAAKGLEFDRVFVAGMEDESCPGNAFDDRAVEEERRIFYVALTRAKKFLTVTSAKSRFTYGEVRLSRPSRFIGELKGAEKKGALDYGRRQKEIINSHDGYDL